MISKSDNSCPECGTALPAAESADQRGRCPVCTMLQETPGGPAAMGETIVADDVRARTFGMDDSGDFSHRSTPHESQSAGEESEVPHNVGRFEIEEVLGKGGFGRVYKAHDPLLDREVALKVPRLVDHDQASFQRFLHEAKAAARLRHPNIVAVFECGMADGQPFIASEYVDGTPLSGFRDERALNVRVAADLIRQVAEAIDYAHSEGIVHRDLKPANIMMSKSGRPQVMDFGLARLMSDAGVSVMSEGSIVGTPAYMAPEQARGDKHAVGPKSDQYSVGVLLYVLLCGRQPYIGDAWSVISRVADPVVQPETPRAVSRHVPRDLEACCLKAMEKNPERRYESLGEMADDLAHWLDGRPLLARPIGVRERLSRWCAANRMIAGLLSVITVLIFAAMIAGYVLAFKFRGLADYANGRATAAETARLAADEARLETEEVLIDTYTEAGLFADLNGSAQEAVLWFGNAAARAQPDSLRERLNRRRFQTWLTKTPVPVRMFQGLGNWHESLSVHPSGQFLLSEERGTGGQGCRILNLKTSEVWASPWDALIDKATWSHDGTILALASGHEIRLLRFPDGELVTAWEHADPVQHLSFSDDDRILAIGGESSAGVRRWSEENPDTRALPTEVPIHGFAWSPSGESLATLDHDGGIHVREADPGVGNPELRKEVLTAAEDVEDSSVRFLSETRLVVPTSDGAVTCVDIANGLPVWSVPCERPAMFAVSPDLSRMAIVDGTELFEVNAETGEELGERIEHPNLIYSVAYNYSGEQLLTGCGDQFARIFMATTGELLTSMRHGDIVHRAAWFPDGTACVTVHWKADLIRVWKLGQFSEDWLTQPLPTRAMHVEWSEDGNWFMPTGMDSWRGPGVSPVLRTSDGTPAEVSIEFPGRVSDGCFIPGRPHALMGGAAAADEKGPKANLLRSQDLSQPGLIIGVNYETGEELFSPVSTASNVVAIEASPDGRVVTVLCHQHELLMLDAESGEVLHRHEVLAGDEFFYGFVIKNRLAFSPLGDRFAVWGNLSRTAEIRSAADGELLFTLVHSNPSNLDWYHNVVFSPDGRTIATCSADQTVQLWDAATGEQKAPVLWHTGWIFAAAFSQDGKRLLTACQDRQARLWNLEDVENPLMLATPTLPDEVYGICFLPGDESFLTGLRNGQISVWDAKQGKMIAPVTVASGLEMAYHIALSRDNARVIVVGRDPNVRLFDAARWQPVVDEEFSKSELQAVGEMIASQELHDGVLIGLTTQAVMERWTQLFKAHANNSVFAWPAKSDFAAKSPSHVADR